MTQEKIKQMFFEKTQLLGFDYSYNQLHGLYNEFIDKNHIFDNKLQDSFELSTIFSYNYFYYIIHRTKVDPEKLLLTSFNMGLNIIDKPVTYENNNNRIIKKIGESADLYNNIFKEDKPYYDKYNEYRNLVINKDLKGIYDLYKNIYDDSLNIKKGIINKNDTKNIGGR